MVGDDPWSAACAAGQQSWPSVLLTGERFRAHGQRLKLTDPRTVNHLADLFLVCAVLEECEAAIALFDAQFLVPARSSMARVHDGHDFLDDVSQELRQKLMVGPDPRLTRYEGRSPLIAWVRVVAIRLAHDVVRAHPFPPLYGRGEALAEIAAASIDPELGLLKTRLRETFQSALREGVEALSLRERAVLRMHLVHHLSIDQIAAPYGVHRATAARWLAEVRDKLRADVIAAVAGAHPGLTSSDIDGLGRLVESQLHLSLSRLARD